MDYDSEGGLRLPHRGTPTPREGTSTPATGDYDSHFAKKYYDFPNRCQTPSRVRARDLIRLIDLIYLQRPIDPAHWGNAPFPVELRVVAAVRMDSYATFFSDATDEASGRRAVTSEGMCT